MNRQSPPSLSRKALPAGDARPNPLTQVLELTCNGGPACQAYSACYQRLKLINSIKGLAGATGGRSNQPAYITESRPVRVYLRYLRRHEYLQYLRRQAGTGVQIRLPDPIPLFPREAPGPVKSVQPLIQGGSYGPGLLSSGGMGLTSYPLKVGAIRRNISYQCVLPATSGKAGLFPAVPRERTSNIQRIELT